jgi:hypothetical protein
MRRYTTTIKAIDPFTGEMCTWGGPFIMAPSWALAQRWCQQNGLGYCLIDGELVAEIPTKKGTTNIPDWDKMIDYDKIDQN